MTIAFTLTGKVERLHSHNSMDSSNHFLSMASKYDEICVSLCTLPSCAPHSAWTKQHVLNKSEQDAALNSLI